MTLTLEKVVDQTTTQELNDLVQFVRERFQVIQETQDEGIRVR